MESNSINESPSELTSKKSVFQYYICPKCHRFPRIQMTQFPDISISCFCNENERQIKDNGKKDILELAKYKTYTISIDRYLEEIQKEKELFHIEPAVAVAVGFHILFRFPAGTDIELVNVGVAAWKSARTVPLSPHQLVAGKSLNDRVGDGRIRIQCPAFQFCKFLRVRTDLRDKCGDLFRGWRGGHGIYYFSGKKYLLLVWERYVMFCCLQSCPDPFGSAFACRI